MMLNNKVAIVTGGTRGIGFAIVRKYLLEGATVSVWGSREESVTKALAKLKEENPDWPVSGLWPSLTDPDQVAEAVAKVKEAYGRVDILVNNAGVSARESIYTYDPKEFDKTIDLNLNAVFYCSQAAARVMKEQGGGVILNTSSMVSLYGQPSGSAYPASKFAVNGLTHSLARELGRDNIRVNAILPGITKTDMVAALPENLIAPLIRTIPLGRVGEPDEVAEAFVFLGSDRASYITGAILSVDGAAMT